MACTICCEILGIDNFNQAPIDIQTAGLGSKECPKCDCDYCEMHATKIGVGLQTWNGGCPHCKDGTPADITDTIPLLPEGTVAKDEIDLRADIQLWHYANKYTY